MRALTAFYEAIVTFVFANLAVIGIAVGVVALLAAAYRYGRHTQHAADRTAMGESYTAGYDDGMLARSRAVRGKRLDVAPLVLWRDVPIERTAQDMAKDAVRDWRAERGLVAE